MTFGEKIRELRKAKNLGQRDLAAKVKVSFTYISKIENEKLDFGDYPSEDLILQAGQGPRRQCGRSADPGQEGPRGPQEAGDPATRRFPQARQPR